MQMISRSPKTNALAGGAAQGIESSSKTKHLNSAALPYSRQVLCVIPGEQQAQAYLTRLQLQRVEVDELAACVAMLSDGVSLVGFCRVLERALGVRK